MGKSKKHRKEESSESENTTESSSSNSSSSSETTSEDSSSSDEEKTRKKNKVKKSKTTKAKTRKRKSSSSSSSSSSSDSDDDRNESSSSSNEGKKPEKKKARKNNEDQKEISKNKKIRTSGDELLSEERINRVENTENVKRETSNLHNRSKWDSPSNDVDDNRRERPREKNWNKEYNDNGNYKRYGRHEDSRGDRYRRNDYRERPDYEVERKRDHCREYEQDRNRDRDQKYRSRENNFTDRRYNTWDNRVRRENRNQRNDRENRNQRDDRENRNQRDDREGRNQKNDRENRNQRDNRENRRSRSPRRPRHFSRKRSEDDEKTYEWGKKEDNENPEKPSEEKEKPNFALSGKLTEDANKVNGVVIKYAEPPEARKPKRRWRLYPFKGEKALPTLYIHRQSCYLIGRDRKVCDLPVDHPSCSKQHAALQYRLVPFEREDGSVGKRVRPYIIDLESANGTFINNKKIESKKYIELLEKDVIKFGFSSREYVLLHENSKEDQLDDDITEEVQVKTEPTDD